MGVRIRGGTLNDAEGIASVLNTIIAERQYSSLSEPFSVEAERDFMSSMDDRGAIFVAEVEGQIIGFQTIEPFATYSRALAHVATIGTFVLQDFRGQGIGSRLLATTLDFAHLMGYEKILAYVRASNDEAQTFYQKLGFVPKGVLEQQVKIGGQYDDQIVMELFISEVVIEEARPLEVKVMAEMPLPPAEAEEEALEATLILEEAAPAEAEKPAVVTAPKPEVPVMVRRAKRQDTKIIAGLISQVRKGAKPLTEADIMERFLQKGFWLAFSKRAAGVAGWQAENLVTCIDDFYFYPPKYREDVVGPLLEAVESEASQLQCEAALLLIDRAVPVEEIEFYRRYGYEPRKLEDLYRVWREVATEYLTDDKFLLVKQLREDRVTKPI